jgi:polyisoprenyl-teichoic acid--peptidoglycan teichoic acid transferase
MSALSPRAFLHRLITAFVVAVVVSTLAVVGAYAQAAQKVAKVAKVSIDTSVLEAGGNYLLIGSDSRAFVDTSQDELHFGNPQQQTGQRSDTIMVAHIDDRTGTALLVSFPRDLWVAIPHMGSAKINAAFNAGPQRVIETIENDFDIPISHYLEVDFQGFRKMVNSIGTIPIYFSAPARDTKSGLSINHAGCQQLNGDQALAYVRSRYYQSLVNGKWQSDPTSDLGRIHRQQYFLRTLAQKTLHAAASSPWNASNLLDSMLTSLQRDPKLGLSALRALAYAFHQAGGVETETLPVNRQFINGQDALVLDAAKAAPLLARLRGIGNPSGASSASSSIDPHSVHVAVENGSGRTGLGARADDALGGLGFSVVGPATNADRSDYSVTEVRYAPGTQAKAQLLLAYLGGAGKVVALGTSAPAGADVVVVLGRDYNGLSRPKAKAQTNPPSSAASPPSGSAAPVTTASTLPQVGC